MKWHLTRIEATMLDVPNGILHIYLRRMLDTKDCQCEFMFIGKCEHYYLSINKSDPSSISFKMHTELLLKQFG